MEPSSVHALNMYSCAELAKLKLPKHPGTERGWLKRVKAESWPYRDVKAPGRNGLRREYQPPPDVQALIDARKDGAPSPEQAAEIGGKLAETLRNAERKQGTVFVNVGLLARLLDAVDAVVERKLDKRLPTVIRLGAAISAYRSMPRYGLPEPLDTVAAHALGQDELEAAVTLALFAMDADQIDPGQCDPIVSIISIIEPGQTRT